MIKQSILSLDNVSEEFIRALARDRDVKNWYYKPFQEILNDVDIEETKNGYNIYITTSHMIVGDINFFRDFYVPEIVQEAMDYNFKKIGVYSPIQLIAKMMTESEFKNHIIPSSENIPNGFQAFEYHRPSGRLPKPSRKTFIPRDVFDNDITNDFILELGNSKRLKTNDVNEIADELFTEVDNGEYINVVDGDDSISWVIAGDIQSLMMAQEKCDELLKLIPRANQYVDDKIEKQRMEFMQIDKNKERAIELSDFTGKSIEESLEYLWQSKVIGRRRLHFGKSSKLPDEFYNLTASILEKEKCFTKLEYITSKRKKYGTNRYKFRYYVLNLDGDFNLPSDHYVTFMRNDDYVQSEGIFGFNVPISIFGGHLSDDDILIHWKEIGRPRFKAFNKLNKSIKKQRKKIKKSKPVAKAEPVAIAKPVAKPVAKNNFKTMTKSQLINSVKKKRDSKCDKFKKLNNMKVSDLIKLIMEST